MPRKIRDASLETRTARARLPRRHKPYYRLLTVGLHIGYRKNADGAGTWLVRQFDRDTKKYTVQNLRTPDAGLVFADDFEDGDGEHVMDFAQAQQAARPQRRAAGSYTVADATSDYLRFLEGDGRSRHSVGDTRCRIDVVSPKLGHLKIDGELTADRLRSWRDALARTAPRLRTKKGEKQSYREFADDEEARRRRRASANRSWTILRAALNHAFNDGKVQSDVAWRKVKPFRQVDGARIRYLTLGEAKRLINACDPDFRPLVRAALETGCRYGELVRLEVATSTRTPARWPFGNPRPARRGTPS